jgi:hypothetical protein
MLQEIFCGWKENLLCAIPLGIAVDSHLKMTIAQFIRDANPGMNRRIASQKARKQSPLRCQMTNP